MRCALLTIGDELLIGQVADTNAAYLAERLEATGHQVVMHLTVGDTAEAIGEALGYALRRANVVIATGGLGPTEDDLTRDVVAGYFGVEQREDAATMKRIEDYFAYRERPMPESNRRLALVPEGFEVMTNPAGTAPGLWRSKQIDGEWSAVALLPGVPREVRALWDAELLSRLLGLGERSAVIHRTLLTTGIGESNLAEELGDLRPHMNAGVGLAFLPSTNGVRLRITARAATQEQAEADAARLAAVIRERAARYVFGEGEDLLEAVVGEMLASAELRLGVAESCTGGLVLSRLTDVPGASQYVRGGVVAYCNSVKKKRLGVEKSALKKHGAVSEVVARQMAEGARERMGADVGLSTTGIMGPGGGSKEKPVGTVWLGYADDDGTHAVRLALTPERSANKALASTAALDLLRRQLLRREGRGES
jgi:nicotinamide-nucleotide amidase